MPLEPNELEVLVIRRHVLFLFLELAAVAFVSLFSFGLILLLALIFTIAGTPILFLLIAAWALLTAFAVLNSLFCYFNTFWEVTTDRVLMHNQLFLFWENSDQCRLEHVQDEPQSSNGVFAFLFDYGTIRVQTAGTAQPFILEHAEKPKVAIAVISEMVRQLANRPKPVYTVPTPATPPNVTV